MNCMVDISSWTGRSFLLTCVVIPPFLRFVLQNRYTLLRPEVGAAAAVLVIACAFLAAVLRTKALLLTGILACIVLTATLPTVRILEPVVRLSTAGAATLLALASGGAIAVMREKFLPLLAIFTWSSVASDLLIGRWAAPQGFRPAPQSGRPSDKRPSQALFLVLDEQMGLGALPTSIPACQCAKQKWSAMLARHQFRVYPYAFSNYPSTLSSIPSLVNRTLLRHRRMLVDRSSPTWQWGVRSLRENRLLEYYSRRGYRIHLFQHQGINHLPDRMSADSVVEYSDTLDRLSEAPGPWFYRFCFLVGNYQQSDRVLQRVKAFFPFRFAPRSIGPLALPGDWPRLFVTSLGQQTRNTLWFAHIMSPHFPYLFRRDGSVRGLQEWFSDRVDRRSSEPQYLARYGRYCEQVEFAGVQMEKLFAGLRQQGLLDSTLIVILGDHGSRIRRTLADKPPTSSDPEVYDYPAEPIVSDLVDRFSAMLAIRFPGSQSAGEVTRKASLLRFLTEALPMDGDATPGPEIDSVYLFDTDDQPIQIPILDYWK